MAYAHTHNLDELITSTSRPAVDINSESLIYKSTDAYKKKYKHIRFLQ